MTIPIDELCSIIVDLRERRDIYRAILQSVNAEIECIDNQIDLWAMED